MGAERLNYARLLREVLDPPPREPLRRVSSKSLAGGDEATLYGVCSLVLESLSAKGHFVRGAPDEAGDGAAVFHDRQGVLRITLRPPAPPTALYGITAPPLLPIGFAAEEAGRALEAALTGVSPQPTDDELGDSLRRLGDFIGKIRRERVSFIGLSERPSAVRQRRVDPRLAFLPHQRGGGPPRRTSPPTSRSARARGSGGRLRRFSGGEETFGVMEAQHQARARSTRTRSAFSRSRSRRRLDRSARHEKRISIDLLTGLTRRFFGRFLGAGAGELRQHRSPSSWSISTTSRK
jgi:hypothetical protein